MDSSPVPEVQSIGIAQLAECLKTTQTINGTKLAIVDVRDKESFEAAHLSNALHAPLDDFQDYLPQLEKLKSQPVVLVCKLGKRSKEAYARLQEAGFSQLYCMEGGMAAWQEQGLPTETKA